MWNKVYDSSTRLFEAVLSKHFENHNVITVCNATTGILGVFYALGLTGSEIITTPLTWSGAFSGIKILGNQLVFANIEEPYLTIDTQSIEDFITPRTRAIFTADFLGYPCQLDYIKQICDKHKLLLIHDGASSIGSSYKNHYSGYFADIAVYSFGRNKPFSTGEGGCIVVKSDTLFDKIQIQLAHPERQTITRETSNPFALNSVMHPFAVEYGLKTFTKQMENIINHQKKCENLLGQNKHSSTDIKYNYYKPFYNKSNKPFGDYSWIPLPYEPLCDINTNINNYLIINELCLQR